MTSGIARARSYLRIHLPQVGFVQFRRFEARESVQPHSHEDLFQLDHFSDGEGSYEVEGERHDMEPGRWFLMEPGRVHAIHGSDTAPPANLTAKFGLPGLDRPLGLPSMFSLPAETNETAVQLFRQAVAEAVLHTEDHQQVAVLRLTELLLCLLRGLEQACAPEEPHPLVRKAQRFMAEHAAERLGLDAVAAAVGVSGEHLCRTFKQATGITLFQHLRQLRVERARARLTDSRQSIAAVAQAAGFASVKDMDRAFKRIVGMTPRTYRQQAGVRQRTLS